MFYTGVFMVRSNSPGLVENGTRYRSSEPLSCPIPVLLVGAKKFLDPLILDDLLHQSAEYQILLWVYTSSLSVAFPINMVIDLPGFLLWETIFPCAMEYFIPVHNFLWFITRSMYVIFAIHGILFQGEPVLVKNHVWRLQNILDIFPWILCYHPVCYSSISSTTPVSEFSGMIPLCSLFGIRDVLKTIEIIIDIDYFILF